VFLDRCGNATDRCRDGHPAAMQPGRLGERLARCFYPNAHWHCASCRRLSAGRSVTAAARRNAVAAHAQSLQDYQVAGREFQAVHEVTIELWPGETLAWWRIGSGKSSLAKLLLGLSAPDAGSAIELSGSH